MKHSRGVYRGRGSNRNQSKRKKNGFRFFANNKNTITGLVLVFLILFGIKSIFFNTHPEAEAASINAQKGSTQFSLENSDSWTFLQDSIDLFAGDKFKTLGNGNAAMNFFGGNSIFVKENSEISIQTLEKTDNSKTAVIKIISGEIWTNVAEKDENTSIIIQTEHQNILPDVGVFAISNESGIESIATIKGSGKSQIRQSTGNETISLSENTQIQIDSSNFDSVNNDSIAEFQTDIPQTFLDSDWHLENLGTFFPTEALELRQKIDEKKEAQNNNQIAATITENPSIASPKITSPAQNLEISAEEDSVQIEGIAPENTYQISINGYTLTKYQPGDQKWLYFASTKFGTMVPGLNEYSVIATTRDGQKSAPAKVTVNYKGADIAPKTFSQINEEANAFSVPEISSPVGLTTAAPWETSSSIITIKGTVPKETNKVTVNEFALRQFKIGSGEFSYIANAQYGNFVKGNNLYVVKAYGPDGKTSETSINIIYTPISL